MKRRLLASFFIRHHVIILVLMTLFSAFLSAIMVFFCIPMSQVVMYDSNYQLFSKLTDDEQRGISMGLKQALIFFAFVFIVLCSSWIVLAWILASLMRKLDRDQPIEDSDTV